ncbi:MULTISPECIES: sugar dehydrogenase complex small subunit [unclassified Tatumella]|uniref:sugar dehydrogenase complex small subunit n=1 Tax=unclassified Tatumella TaxID=2649542 RepID=UPI001BB079D0|nr:MULTISPECIES: sugar dehydrogenase complex small subunit [unclassified Tatumella]MBS0875824.1 sorbitol dehydrogenase family protein [Tatumella sp. JGM82]MBS0890229.1 sorbitol dehydrogenase family protein [Tatumella sp. JGM94]MBS0900355.1 sorbitol dehydrogenase family protein [Tatumella sp. JGM100]
MLSRRNLLKTGLYLTGFAAFTPALSRALLPSQNSDNTVFYKLSLLLTGRTQLSQLLSQRALTCLTKEDSDFPVKLTRLIQVMNAANITRADQLNGHRIMSVTETGDTVKKIISAWYLGFTGTPLPLRATDNTRFVTYTDAMMYAPTSDATVIPTYSRGQTNYWVRPPVTILTD